MTQTNYIRDAFQIKRAPDRRFRGISYRQISIAKTQITVAMPTGEQPLCSLDEVTAFSFDAKRVIIKTKQGIYVLMPKGNKKRFTHSVKILRSVGDLLLTVAFSNTPHSYLEDYDVKGKVGEWRNYIVSRGLPVARLTPASTWWENTTFLWIFSLCFTILLIIVFSIYFFTAFKNT